VCGTSVCVDAIPCNRDAGRVGHLAQIWVTQKSRRVVQNEPINASAVRVATRIIIWNDLKFIWLQLEIVRPMSHLRFYRATLSRDKVARQNRVIKSQVWHRRVAAKPFSYPVFSWRFITGPSTHSVGGQHCFALWRRPSSVVVCNTPRRACRRLHPTWCYYMP